MEGRVEVLYIDAMWSTHLPLSGWGKVERKTLSLSRITKPHLISSRDPIIPLHPRLSSTITLYLLDNPVNSFPLSSCKARYLSNITG